FPRVNERYVIEHELTNRKTFPLPSIEQHPTRVFRAKDRETNQLVVLKTSVSLEAAAVASLHREYLLSGRAQHPNIRRVLGYDSNGIDGDAIIFEWMNGPSLRDHLEHLAETQR